MNCDQEITLTLFMITFLICSLYDTYWYIIKPSILIGLGTRLTYFLGKYRNGSGDPSSATWRTQDDRSLFLRGREAGAFRIRVLIE
jgi:hypothetical protein